MNHPLKLLPVFASVALHASPARAAEPLEAADREAITKLFDAFQADLANAKSENYGSYFDKASLAKFMAEHRSFITSMRKFMSPEQFSEVYAFTPDLETALQEQDPEKYFKGIKPGKTTQAMSEAANIVVKVVTVSGDRGKAFVVAEGQFKGELGTTEPYYSVWPAVMQDGEWRFDVSSNLVRDLRVKNKQLQQRAMLQEGLQPGK